MKQKYKSRTVSIFLIFLLLYGVILLNLYYIQIQQGTFFKELGKKQYNVTVSQFPERAHIIDRNGKPLAINKDCLSAFIMPNQLTEPQKVKQFLQEVFPSAYTKLNDNPGKRFLFIKRRITNEEKKQIEAAQLKDIKILKERGRFYPVKATGAIVGATNIDNNGLFGIEYQFNEKLRGNPAIYSLEQDARSGQFYFKKETKKAESKGKQIQLTLDSDLQFLIYEELAETIQQWDALEGSVIVIDPSSGDIHVMVTCPTCDTNSHFFPDQEHIKNKVVTDCYEYGSIAKTFAALAALEEGKVTIDEQFDCGGSKTAIVDGRTVNTLVAHGVLTLSEIVERSNNIGIAQVAKRVGEKLYDHYTALGFGTKTGIQFPGEQAGFVNPPSNWSKQSLISLSYGYEMSCTLLQIAQAYACIANDGTPIKPKLILETNPQPSPKQTPLYSQESIQTIKQILQRTTEQGTARRAAIKGYRIMSKTGTANLLVDGNYSQDHNIYTCAGIIEKDNYKRVVVAFVKEAQKEHAYASTVAAPLLKKVIKKILIHDKIM